MTGRVEKILADYQNRVLSIHRLDFLKRKRALGSRVDLDHERKPSITPGVEK
jgi:hypothetical protein